MDSAILSRIVDATNAQSVERVALIQSLWNGYGTLSRVYLVGAAQRSVVVKHVQVPSQLTHPRGFANQISNHRKMKSYDVERHWYEHQNRRTHEHCRTPKCLASFDVNGEPVILLEDLCTQGFTSMPNTLIDEEVRVVLRWLAHFHAQFVGDVGEGLWTQGCYWHLATRPDELKRIQGSRIHRYAAFIDARLRRCRFSTLVHGDAKLANFCFTADHRSVAAVDFQYVGHGCAMSDVAYFLSSCLSGADCRRYAPALLDEYFETLTKALPSSVDAVALEAEWRALYPYAWADFQRFLLGWSPSHKKLTDYLDDMTERVLDEIEAELVTAARAGSLSAGDHIRKSMTESVQVASKGMASTASDIVTEVDFQSQKLILDALQSTIERFDLGVLAEEADDDGSRLKTHAFWTVDPLDGTQFFASGKAGFATSIALVAQDGQPLLGVAYRPVEDELYVAILGKGVTLNDRQLEVAPDESLADTPVTWFADLSFQKDADYERLSQMYNVVFAGGAVTNVLMMLTEPRSVYLKRPKKKLGGCAIWDLAAVSLMLTELGGRVQTFFGDSLELNRPDTLYFNECGLRLTGAGVSRVWRADLAP